MVPRSATGLLVVKDRFEACVDVAGADGGLGVSCQVAVVPALRGAVKIFPRGLRESRSISCRGRSRQLA